MKLFNEAARGRLSSMGWSQGRQELQSLEGLRKENDKHEEAWALVLDGASRTAQTKDFGELAKKRALAFMDKEPLDVAMSLNTGFRDI